MAKKLNQIEVLNIIKSVHGELYDYSNLTYKSSRTKVELICRIHGSFFSALDQLKRGQGCPICGKGNAAKKRRVSFEEFEIKAKVVHESRYTYDSTSYIKISEKVKINCPEHGWFIQNASSHIDQKQGCPDCGRESQSQKRQLGIETFLERARNVHGTKYDYSNVNYLNQIKKVTIICPIHGQFYQEPQNHLTGSACPKCAIIDQHKLQLKGVEEFIQDSIKIHGDKYDYSQVDYQGGKKMVKLICPKHGGFHQTPNNHQRGNGCPNCNSSKGEEQIKRFLESHHIAFIQQHTFPELKDRRLLKCDFYLPDHNIVIEFHGRQHYEVVHSFGGEAAYLENVRRDKLKRTYLLNKGINFIEISYKQNIKSILEEMGL
jgi:hypothetical protein